jgi:hypothetical protein
MSTTADRLHEWPRICVKCQAIIDRTNAKRARAPQTAEEIVAVIEAMKDATCCA